MLAVSDQGFYFEQEKLIALDEEEQIDGRTRPLVLAGWKIEGKGRDESAEPDSQESWQKLAGRTIVSGDRLQENLLKSFLVENEKVNENYSVLTNLVARAAEIWSCKGYFPAGATFELAL